MCHFSLNMVIQHYTIIPKKDSFPCLSSHFRRDPLLCHRISQKNCAACKQQQPQPLHDLWIWGKGPHCFRVVLSKVLKCRCHRWQWQLNDWAGERIDGVDGVDGAHSCGSNSIVSQHLWCLTAWPQMRNDHPPAKRGLEWMTIGLQGADDAKH